MLNIYNTAKYTNFKLCTERNNVLITCFNVLKCIDVTNSSTHESLIEEQRLSYPSDKMYVHSVSIAEECSQLLQYNIPMHPGEICNLTLNVVQGEADK